MRAALLPTPGEPFLLSYWLRNFDGWRSEVDELVVLVNGDPTHVEYIPLPEDGIRFRFLPRPIGHGPALRWLLENTEADHVVLCEDDAYVRDPAAVRLAFTKIVSGHTDVIGSPRYEDAVSSPIEEWPPVTGSPQDLGRALWPAFLFAKRSDLLDTDRGFEDRRFRLGEMLPGLNTPVTPEMCEWVGVGPDHIHVDTLYATTWQLRHKRIELVHRTRVLQGEAAEEWIKYDPPWFHVSGLSAIWMVLAGQYIDLPDWGTGGGLWPRRIAWWERTYRTAPQELRDSTYGRHYRERLTTFRQRTGISAAQVDEWDALFEPWATVAVPA